MPTNDDKFDVSDESLRTVLKYDPVADSERKHAVKAGDAFMLDMISNMALKSSMLDKALSERGDTRFGCKYMEAVKIMDKSPLEFECVLVLPRFSRHDYFDNTYEEEERLYWSRNLGILVHMESFMGAVEGSCNTIRAYMEVAPVGDDRDWGCLDGFSHGLASKDPNDMSRAANLDCREAMHYKLKDLVSKGTWAPRAEWQGARSGSLPFVWLVSYSQKNLEELGGYKKVAMDKVAASPNEDFRNWAARCLFGVI